jgi:hypothetical protein
MDSNKVFLANLQKANNLSNQEVGELLRRFPMPPGEEISQGLADRMAGQDLVDQTLDPFNYAL